MCRRARAQLRLLLRGWLGGELCRHARQHGRCPDARCTFAHPEGCVRAPAAPAAAAAAPPPASAAAGGGKAGGARRTFGVSQYKEWLRPDAGLILVTADSNPVAIRSQSGHNPVAIRSQSGHNPVAIRSQSGRNPVAIR